jgi:hypothetical protein
MLFPRRSLLVSVVSLAIGSLLYVLTNQNHYPRSGFDSHTARTRVPSPETCNDCSSVTFTHLISPFVAEPNSFSAMQQQLVAQSIAAAVVHAAGLGLAVEVLGITTDKELQGVLPPLRALPVLNRTLGDLLAPSVQRFPNAPLNSSLPILADILNAGYTFGQGHFLIYTNADIGLLPHFYSQVFEMLSLANATQIPQSALSITRRTVLRNLTSLSEIYAHASSPTNSAAHQGEDCLVCRSHSYVSALFDCLSGISAVLGTSSTSG